MKKSNLITVSAAVLLLSLQSAAAQVCTTPPTCDALGYTKSASECSGMTMLKCPLDQSKVYCPSADEINSSGTYKVGDTYVDANGIGIGTVAQVDSTGKHGIVVANAAIAGTQSEVSMICNTKENGGLNWGIADATLLSKTIPNGNLDNCYWVASGFCAVAKNYVNWCNLSGGPCSGTTSESVKGAYCQASF